MDQQHAGEQMIERPKEEMTSEQLAAHVATLDDEDRETLDLACAMVAPCFGENPKRSAMLVLGDGGTIRLVALNCDAQEAYDLVEFAHQACKDLLVGDKPEVKEMH
jgi:hypothetical protein